MDPQGFMRIQAALLLVSCCLIVFTPGRITVWFAIGLLLLAAVSLAGAYRRKLGRRIRSPERRDCDREVSRQITLIVAASTVCALAGTIHGGLFLWDSSRLTSGAALFCAFWLAIYVSSLVDWYYVRSRRDGVVVPPPCRNAQDTDWTLVTRVWWANRCMVVLVCYVVGIASVVAFGLAALGNTGGSGATVGSLVVAGTVAATGAVRLFYGNLSAVGEAFTSCFFSRPDIVLGDKLVGPNGFVGGYVRDIALEGITVVLLDPENGPRMNNGKPRTKRHSLKTILSSSELETQPFEGCGSGCARVNEYCQWSHTQTETPAMTQSAR
jgi:hypothetical protein